MDFYCLKIVKFYTSFIVLLSATLFMSVPIGLAEGSGVDSKKDDHLVAEATTARGYDSNIFLTKKDQKGASMTTIRPRLSLALEPKGALFLNLKYEGYFKFYDRDEYSKENQQDQTASWNLGFKPSRKLRFGVRGEDVVGSVKRDERQNLLRSNGNVVKFNNLLTTLYLEQGIGERWNIDLSWTGTERDYSHQDSEDYEDSKSQRTDTALEYKLKKSFSLRAGYRQTAVDFQETTSDYGEQEGYGGFSWEVKSGLKVSCLYGQAWQEYDFGGQDQKKDHSTTDARLDLSLGQGTIINASYLRSSNYISLWDNQNSSYISDSVSVKVRHNLFAHKVNLLLSGRYTVCEFDLIERKDRLWGEDARLAWQVLKPLLLILDGNFTKSQYTYDLSSRQEYRTDRSWSIRAGLDWKIFNSLLLSLSDRYTLFKYRTEYQDNPDDLTLRKDGYYEASSRLAYSLNKRIGFEFLYQYLENRSQDQRTHKNLEDKEYIDHRYSAGLKISF